MESPHKCFLPESPHKRFCGQLSNMFTKLLSEKIWPKLNFQKLGTDILHATNRHYLEDVFACRRVITIWGWAIGSQRSGEGQSRWRVSSHLIDCTMVDCRGLLDSTVRGKSQCIVSVSRLVTPCHSTPLLSFTAGVCSAIGLLRVVNSMCSIHFRDTASTEILWLTYQ